MSVDFPVGLSHPMKTRNLFMKRMLKLHANLIITTSRNY